MQKLRSVQVLRGVAASAVALMHAHFSNAPDPLAPHWTQMGAAGVDLFFVISGFIMASIPKRAVGSFVFDRLWRIFPMWWLALLPWLLVVPADWPARLQMIILWPVTDLPAVPFLNLRWTLSFELLFYAAVAFSIRRGAWPPLLLFATALVAGFATRLPLFNFFGNPMIFEFLFGVAVAKLPRSLTVAPFLAILAAVIMAVAPLGMYPGEIALNPAVSGIRVLLWGFPAALLLYAALSAERMFQHKAVGPLVMVGNASYSIYLFHTTAIRLLHLPWLVEWAGALAVGLAIWWLVERQVLALKPRLTSATFADVRSTRLARPARQ